MADQFSFHKVSVLFCFSGAAPAMGFVLAQDYIEDMHFVAKSGRLFFHLYVFRCYKGCTKIMLCSKTKAELPAIIVDIVDEKSLRRLKWYNSFQIPMDFHLSSMFPGPCSHKKKGGLS